MELKTYGVESQLSHLECILSSSHKSMSLQTIIIRFHNENKVYLRPRFNKTIDDDEVRMYIKL